MRVALLSLSLSVLACRGPDGDVSAGETSESGETGGDEGGICAGEFETFLETQPWFSQAKGGDALFVAAGVDLVLTWDEAGGWRQQVVPELWQVEAMWASAWDDVWLYGRAGDADAELAVYRWDGEALEASFELEEDEIIHAMSGSGPGDVWAVGASAPCDQAGCAFVLHHDGQAWTREALPVFGEPWTIWARGPDEVYVAAEHTFRFDGEQWTQVASSSFRVRGLTGDAQRVLGHDGQRVYELSADGWEAMATPGGVGEIRSLALVGDAIWVLGEYGGAQRVSRWDGGVWQSFEIAGREVFGLVRVGDEPWLGVSTQPWDLGHEIWRLTDIEEHETVYVDARIGHVEELAGWRRDGIYAVARNTERSGVGRLDESGWQWQVAQGLESIEILDVDVDVDGDVWLAGADYDVSPARVLWRVQGSQAVPVETPPQLGVSARSLWVAAKDDIWLLSNDQSAHFDGESWLTLAAPPDVREIRGAGGHVYLWSSYALYELRNGSWYGLLGSVGQLLDFAVAGPNAVWVVARDDVGETRVHAWDGVEWTAHELGTRHLCDVVAGHDEKVHVSGYWQEPGGGTVHGVLMTWDGRAWTSIDTPAQVCGELLALEDGLVLGEGDATHLRACAN